MGKDLEFLSSMATHIRRYSDLEQGDMDRLLRLARRGAKTLSRDDVVEEVATSFERFPEDVYTGRQAAASIRMLKRNR